MVRNLTSSSISSWVETIKSDNIWNYVYISKIKVIGKQGEKLNELNIHTIYYLTEYVCSYGLPKVQIRGLVAIYENVLK